jgi:type III secretion protein Q
VLRRHRQPLLARWMDTDWSFQLRPHPPHPPAARAAGYVAGDWGGARVFAGVSDFAGLQLAGGVLDAALDSSCPPELVMACLESAIEELSAAVEESTRKHFRVAGIGREAPAPAGLERHGWHARSESLAIEGELLLDADAARFLATALREHPAAPQDGDWDGLGIAARLLVGWLDVSARALGEIELRDVLVLDECLLSGANRLLLQLGPSVAIGCELDGAQLHVMEGVHEIMSDPADTSDAAAILDDVPVRLTFDLGDRDIPLGELRSLQPGYVFNLGRDPRSTVTIRANGRPIGEGELVDIEGRVGVSVLRLGTEAAADGA